MRIAAAVGKAAGDLPVLPDKGPGHALSDARVTVIVRNAGTLTEAISKPSTAGEARGAASMGYPKIAEA